MQGLEISREFAERLLSAASCPAALVDDRLQIRLANRAFQQRFLEADGGPWIGRIAAHSDGEDLTWRMTAALARLVSGRQSETVELAIETWTPEGGVLRMTSPGRGCDWAMLELLEADLQRGGTSVLDDRDAVAGVLHELGQPLQTLSLLHGLLATKLKDPAELGLLRGMEQCASALSGMIQSFGAEISPPIHPMATEAREVQIAHVLAPLCEEFSYHAWVRGIRWRAVLGRATVRSNRGLLIGMLRKVLAQVLGEQQTGGTVLLGVRRRGPSVVIEIWTSGAERRTEPVAGSALDVAPASHRVSGRLLHALARGSVQTLAEHLGITLEVHRRANHGQTVRLMVPGAQTSAERASASHLVPVVGSIGEQATIGETPHEPTEMDRHWTIFVVDDDRALSLAMHHALQSRFPVQSFDSAEAFLHALDAEPGEAQGCLLVDLNLPGMDGLQLLEAVRDRHPTVSCIMITAHGDVRWAVRAMQSGAIDFVEKPINLETLLAALQRARGQARSAETPPADDALEVVSSLTPRQREIMLIVVQGKTNREAAEILGLSQRTVENHRYEIMRRTASKTFSDLVKLAFRAGMLVAPLVIVDLWPMI